MIVLEPIKHNTIWGGPRISEYTGVEGTQIGHLYSCYSRKEMSNSILNGEWKGKCLNDIFPILRDRFFSDDNEYFPLTLALTEADQNLSIQVHPTDKFASEIESKARGKRESWYFIEPPRDGYIINGCTCKSDAEKCEMLEQKQYLEMCDKLEIQVGDYVFVEPGTLHSITGGSLVYEIEEGADYTYRFYDYDRVDSDGKPRELHIEKASSVLDIGLKSQVKKYSATDEIVELTYSTKKIVNQTSYVNESNTLECITLISGSMQCDGIYVKSGMTVLLYPAEVIEDANIELAFVAKERKSL